MKNSVLNRLRCMFMTLLLAHLVSACGVAARWGDITSEFSPKSDAGMVIGGVHPQKSDVFVAIFRQYDPETQRLIPGGYSFKLIDAFFHHDHSAWKVPPGHYALTMAYFDAPNLIFATPLGYENYSSWTDSVASDASLANVETYRFKVSPGEMVYLGEFKFGVFKPRWQRNEARLQKILKLMVAAQGMPIFRPPVAGVSLDAGAGSVAQCNGLLAYEMDLAACRTKWNSDLQSALGPKPTDLRKLVLQVFKSEGWFSQAKWYSGIGPIGDHTEMVMSEVVPQVVAYRNRYSRGEFPGWKFCVTLVNPPAKPGGKPRVGTMEVAYRNGESNWKNRAGLSRCLWYEPTSEYLAGIEAAKSRLISAGN